MNIINQLIELITRQRKPKDISYNINAAIAFTVASVFTNILVFTQSPEYTQPILYAIILNAGYILAMVVLLKVHKRENRLVQTLTALFGTSCLLSIAVYALSLVPFLALLVLVVQIYGLILYVYIIREAFDCPILVAIVIFIATHIFSGVLLIAICPNVLPEAMLMLENAQQTAQTQQ